MSEYNLPIAVNASLDLPPEVLSKIVSSEKMSSMVQDKYDKVLKPDINTIVDSKNSLLESSMNSKITENRASRENIIRALGYSLVISDKEPKNKEEFGVPVIWMDTRDPNKWTPSSVIIDDTSKTLVIPFDKGVDYYKNGEIISEGTYPMIPEESPYEVVVMAVPKPGYKIVGTNRWSEFITPGYRTYFYDTLKTGVFDAGRSSGGVTYQRITNPENVTITQSGLRASIWTKGASGQVPLDNSEYIGIKSSVDYSLNNQSITIGNSIVSLAYGGNQTTSVQLTNTYINMTSHPLAKSVVKEDIVIPPQGTLSLETTKAVSKAFINGELAATMYHNEGVLSVGNFVRMTIVGGNESKPNIVSNLKVELK